MMESLSDLRVFTLVARRGSFAAAAAEMGVTRSSVSKRIARLEAKLGVRLLQRTTRRMALTPAGAELADGVGPALAELEEVARSVASASHEPTGLVRIAVPLAFGVRRVAPALHRFCEQYPRIELDVSYSDARTDLAAGGFDLAVRGGVLDDSSLLARRLCGLEVQLVASEAYLSAHGVPRHPSDLERHRLILYRRTPFPVVCDGSRTLIRARPSMVANNADVRRMAAESGLGIAFVPDFAIDPDTALVRVLPECQVGQPGIAFYLLRPPGARPRRAVRLLSEHLVHELAQSRPAG